MIWETIRETLSELPEEQRSVFVETEFEDKSYKEISERTGECREKSADGQIIAAAEEV